MKAWASFPDRCSTILASSGSEKTFTIREVRSSVLRVLLIECFQAGHSLLTPNQQMDDRRNE